MKTHNNPDRFATRTQIEPIEPFRLELLEQIKHYFEQGDYKKMQEIQALIRKLKK